MEEFKEPYLPPVSHICDAALCSVTTETPSDASLDGCAYFIIPIPFLWFARYHLALNLSLPSLVPIASACAQLPPSACSTCRKACSLYRRGKSRTKKRTLKPEARMMKTRVQDTKKITCLLQLDWTPLVDTQKQVPNKPRRLHTADLRLQMKICC